MWCGRARSSACWASSRCATTCCAKSCSGRTAVFLRRAGHAATTATSPTASGNLASRTLTMIERYFGGEIPQAARGSTASRGRRPGTAEFASEALTEVTQLYDQSQLFAGAGRRSGNWSPSIDKYLTVEKPWTLAEKPEDRARLATVLYTAAEGLRIIAALAHPVLAAIDAENLAATGPDRAAERTFNWICFPGGSSSPAPRLASRKVFSRALKNPKRLKGLKPWSRNRIRPATSPARRRAGASPAAASAAATAAARRRGGRRAENRHRRFCQSGDARRPGEIRRARGGRRQAAATAGRHRRRSPPDRRRDRHWPTSRKTSSAAKWWWSPICSRASCAAWNRTA